MFPNDIERDPNDKYVKHFGKTRQELLMDRKCMRYAEHYEKLTELGDIDDIHPDMKDVRTLDHKIYEHALTLDKLGADMAAGLYAEDGTLCTKNLEAYLRVVSHFSDIYERTNRNLARRFLVHRGDL